jgi:hypothetical protein
MHVSCGYKNWIHTVSNTDLWHNIGVTGIHADMPSALKWSSAKPGREHTCGYVEGFLAQKIDIHATMPRVSVSKTIAAGIDLCHEAL